MNHLRPAASSQGYQNLGDSPVELRPRERSPSPATSTEALLPNPPPQNQAITDADADADSASDSDQGQGEPTAKSLTTWVDTGAILVALAALTVSVLAVWIPSLALQLGQTNQIIVIGLALNVMARCTQRQAQLALIVFEVRYGRSSLRNLEALLRNTAFAQSMGWLPRASLLLLLALPLALGASYKRFSGGQVSVGSPPRGAQDWGLVSAPGWPVSGNGISLAVNSYVPFWQNPNWGRTYGYNLFVASNTTAALLDAPFPAYRQQLQETLGLGQFVLLNATVNATVSENVDLTPAQQNDPAFWQGLRRGGYGRFDKDLSSGMWSGLQVQESNVSEIFISIWSKPDETFNATAQRYVQTRRYCWGQWNITATNITLIRAQLLEDNTNRRPPPDQRLIQGHNGLTAANDLGRWFSELIPEFNYKWYPRPGVRDTNTFPALVAAMVWGRVITFAGAEKTGLPLDRAAATEPFVRYTKQPRELDITLNAIALHPSFWLLFVLLINPVFTLLCTIFKGALYSTPVDEGFGLVSMLAGVRKESLSILRGAALSGQLKRDIRVRFQVDGEDTKSRGFRRVTVDVDSSGPPGAVGRKAKYG